MSNLDVYKKMFGGSVLATNMGAGGGSYPWKVRVVLCTACLLGGTSAVEIGLHTARPIQLHSSPPLANSLGAIMAERLPSDIDYKPLELGKHGEEKNMHPMLLLSSEEQATVISDLPEDYENIYDDIVVFGTDSEEAGDFTEVPVEELVDDPVEEGSDNWDDGYVPSSVGYVPSSVMAGDKKGILFKDFVTSLGWNEINTLQTLLYLLNHTLDDQARMEIFADMYGFDPEEMSLLRSLSNHFVMDSRQIKMLKGMLEQLSHSG